MKPVKLEFEGINSFSEHTIIDFESLTKSGIFGIFGDTGSGKSTILDSINFALYGKVERSKEKTDIINYRCTSAGVKFTFTMVNCGERRTYLVERVIKKDKSGTHKAFLYENGLCIADKPQEVEKKIVEILGVEAEDFRKCIALPQGEFAQFVKSAPRDRLYIIERLFSLSRYGERLKEKIAERQKEADAVLQQIRGKLSAYADVTAEVLNETEQLIADGEKRRGVLETESLSAQNNYLTLKNLLSAKNELENAKRNLAVLEGKRAEMEELRANLSVLRICVEVSDTAAKLKDAEKSIAEIGEKIKKTDEEIVNGEKSLKKYEEMLADGGFEKREEELISLAAKYQTCAGKPEKLDEIADLLERKRGEFKAEEQELEKLYAQKVAAEEEIKKFSGEAGSVDTDYLEKFVNTEFRGAVLRKEYVSMLDYFAGLKYKTEAYDDGSELYGFIHAELARQVEIYKQRVLDVKDLKLENVAEQFEKLRNAIKQKTDDGEKLRAADEKLNAVCADIKLAVSRLDKLKEDGVELRKRHDDLKGELIKVFGEQCADYSAAERANDSALKTLREERDKLKSETERIKSGLSELKLLAAGYIKEEENLIAAQKDYSARLDALLVSSGFDSVGQCEELTRKFKDTADAESVLKKYDGDCAVLNAKLSEFAKIVGINDVSEETVATALEVKNIKERELNELANKLAVLKSKYGDLTLKFTEKQDILKEEKTAADKLALIEKLKEVTKNNKFMEYIADEYLCDISMMASSTLLKLTDGRYFLTYKDNNFNVGDNFDCGNLRGVNTLSGGETFLVSLSLALALSQTICARSLKSIEFFFLDEGFGTLDSTLVDTVMTALEKLKSSQFIIGVISHVEELKHRIDCQITVNKATETRGSTVRVSC